MARTRAAFLALAACALGLAACSSTPFEYRSGTEIAEGPGMLSGADGSFPLRPAEPVAPRDEAEWQEFREWRAWQRRRKAAKD